MTQLPGRNLLLAAALFAGGSARATVTVDLGGGADFTEIQPALDAATDGETVLVRPGEYIITAPLDFNRLRDPTVPDLPPPKDLTLRSEGGRDVTTIRMTAPPAGEDPAQSVIHFRNSESGSSAVIGFTLTGGESGLRYDEAARARLLECRITGIRGSGHPEDIKRAAVECDFAGPELMEDCEVVDNDAHGIGGFLGAALIRRCRISRNSGSGIVGDSFAAIDCEVTENGRAGIAGGESVRGCLVRDNVGFGISGFEEHGVGPITSSVIQRNGGGVGSDDVVISNCLITENRGPGAVALYGLRVAHCTIADNEAEGIQSHAPIGNEASVADSIIWRNSGPWMTFDETTASPVVHHSDTSEPWPGVGNLSTDPLFCDEANYALSQESPCLSSASDGRSMGALTGACGEVTLDDGEPGTQPSGSWLTSGAPNPYGTQSLYSNQAQPELLLGAQYAYTLLVPQAGEYDVQLWWTEWSSRLTSVPVEITHAGGTETVHINQRQNGGKWSSLGKWTFDGLAHVTIRSLGGGSTSADAVRLLPVSDSPPLVLDNGEEGTFPSGNWLVSGGTGSYGPSSLYSRDGASSYYRYTVIVPSPGAYRVSLWWTQYPSRSDRVRVVVAAQPRGEYTTVYVDQRTGGSRWNSIGVFDLTYSAEVYIWSSGSGTSTCADAVMLEALPVVPVDIIVDNGKAGTSSTGSWSLSGGSQPYGTTSLYSKQAGATYSYTVDLPMAGDYEVFLWWSGYPSRPPSVTVEIHTTTFATGRLVDQRSNAGQWNPVFSFTLVGTVTIKIISQGNGSACADAVRFLRKV